MASNSWPFAGRDTTANTGSERKIKKLAVDHAKIMRDAEEEAALSRPRKRVATTKVYTLNDDTNQEENEDNTFKADEKRKRNEKANNGNEKEKENKQPREKDDFDKYESEENASKSNGKTKKTEKQPKKVNHKGNGNKLPSSWCAVWRHGILL